MWLLTAVLCDHISAHQILIISNISLIHSHTLNYSRKPLHYLLYLQTACVDLSPLGSGRPRDIWSCSTNTASVAEPAMREVVLAQVGVSTGAGAVAEAGAVGAGKEEVGGQCVTVITSLGQLLVLSVNALEALGNTDAATNNSSETTTAADTTATVLGVESALLSAHQVKAEPRLTAVVSWNPAAAAAHGECVELLRD